MPSEQCLSVSLLLALCSNASLLFILTFKAFHDDGSNEVNFASAASVVSTQRQGRPMSSVDLNPADFATFSNDIRSGIDQNRHGYTRTYSSIAEARRNVGDKIRDQSALGDEQLSEKTFVYNGLDKGGGADLNQKVKLSYQFYGRLLSIDPKLHLSKRFGSQRISANKYESSGGKVSAHTIDNNGLNYHGLKQSNLKASETLRLKKKGSIGKSRQRRDSSLLDMEAGADGSYLNYDFQFAKLKENGTVHFSKAVSDILIPGLEKFEDVMIRHVEELHFSMLSHDLRLERVEKAILNLANGRDRNSGSRRRRGDQLDELDELAGDSKDVLILLDDDANSPGNVSLEELENDSSGDSNINGNMTANSNETATSKTTTTSTTTTSSSTTSTRSTTAKPTQPVEYFDLQRDMQSIRQKVLALENYNTMSNSELNRVRSEVMMMDDKVIEMQRVQKNSNSVTGQHTYKLNELEMVLNRNSMTIATTIDAYGRVSSRVREFRDRLADFEREIHGVSTHFSKHEQISNELRSADSYKAHDIMEIRKAMLNMETRLNEIYNVMEQSMGGVRTDIHSWIDRLCFNNHLAC